MGEGVGSEGDGEEVEEGEGEEVQDGEDAVAGHDESINQPCGARAGEQNFYYDDDVDADADDNDDDIEDKDDVVARGSALMRNVCGVVQERLRAELSSKSHKGSDAWLKKELVSNKWWLRAHRLPSILTQLKHPVPHPDFLMNIRVWIPDEEFKVEMDMVCPEGHPGVTKWGYREKRRASTMMIGLNSARSRHSQCSHYGHVLFQSCAAWVPGCQAMHQTHGCQGRLQRAPASNHCALARKAGSLDFCVHPYGRAQNRLPG